MLNIEVEEAKISGFSDTQFKYI